MKIRRNLECIKKEKEVEKRIKAADATERGIERKSRKVACKVNRAYEKLAKIEFFSMSFDSIYLLGFNLSCLLLSIFFYQNFYRFLIEFFETMSLYFILLKKPDYQCI